LVAACLSRSNTSLVIPPPNGLFFLSPTFPQVHRRCRSSCGAWWRVEYHLISPFFFFFRFAFLFFSSPSFLLFSPVRGAACGCSKGTFFGLTKCWRGLLLFSIFLFRYSGFRPPSLSGWMRRGVRYLIFLGGPSHCPLGRKVSLPVPPIPLSYSLSNVAFW